MQLEITYRESAYDWVNVVYSTLSIPGEQKSESYIRISPFVQYNLRQQQQFITYQNYATLSNCRWSKQQSFLSTCSLHTLTTLQFNVFFLNLISPMFSCAGLNTFRLSRQRLSHCSNSTLTKLNAANSVCDYQQMHVTLFLMNQQKIKSTFTEASVYFSIGFTVSL